MSTDGLAGKVNRLKACAASPEVQFWIQSIKEIQERVIAQNLNAGGEAAVRGWGIMQGLSMSSMIDKIYEKELNDKAGAQIIRPR